MPTEDHSVVPFRWQQIEEVLSNSPEDRTNKSIKRLLPWFRERSTLFKSLGDESLSGVVKFAGLVRYKADSVLVHQGEFGNCFFIIVHGSAAVYAKKLEESDDELMEPVLLDVTTVKGAKDRLKFGQEICDLKAGRCFGELSVIGKHTKRNATIISDEACLLVTIERDVFSRYVSEKHGNEIVRRISFISSHPLFRSWSPAYRNLLVENLQLRQFKYGDTVVKQGDNVDVVYFVLEGQVTLKMNPIKHRGQYKDLVSKVERSYNEDEDTGFDPFKEITVMERRKLRREEGYYACEQRYRQVNICTVGSGGMLGDIEAILELPLYTVTAECIQELEIYEIDKSSFIRIVVKKNPETHEKMRNIVHEKILFRNNRCFDSLPIYNALLKFFDKPKPKDKRKQIIKAYLKKKENKKKNAQNPEFFNKMFQKTNYSTTILERLPDYSEDETAAQPEKQKTKQPLWRNAAGFAAKMNLSHKSKQQGKESTESKQFTANEYKDLKKQMASLGKSTRNGGWSK